MDYKEFQTEVLTRLAVIESKIDDNKFKLLQRYDIIKMERGK